MPTALRRALPHIRLEKMSKILTAKQPARC
jgi:hypothetical protein